MQRSFPSRSEFEREIEGRLGLVPNLFRSAPAAPEVPHRFWLETVSDFLDNPLPSLFKERLFVYLSRLCSARYSVVRHAGFLTGKGRIAGDAAAPAQTREQLVALLRLPLPDEDGLQMALGALQNAPGEQQQLPEPESALEQAVFLACGAIYLDPQHGGLLRDTLAHVLGRQWSEHIFLLIGYATKVHFWVKLHPEIPIEADMKEFLEHDPELARMLLEAEPKQPMRGSRGESRQRAESLDPGFISMMNHELRTPVAAISAVSDMLQMIGTADERLRNASGVLHRQVQAMTRVMDRLMDLSGVLSGALPLALTSTPLNTSLTAVLREFGPRLEEKEIRLDLQLPDSPIVLQADPQRLQQLLENLLSHILARCKPAQPLQIAVSDDGKRMMARFTLPLTSTPARRPSGPLPRASGGTTSLALAQALAQRQAGTLAALDESGGHTGFVLHLPLGEMTPATAAPAMRTRLRVLSIEDNWDFAQLFQHMLQIMGCELEMTSDAEAGLKLARERSPQLIFCDIGLPGDMDGYDFARKLRADPALAHLPLVAVSAYCTPDDVKRALEAGFDRVCGKPVKFAEISAALSAFSNGTLRNF